MELCCKKVLVSLCGTIAISKFCPIVSLKIPLGTLRTQVLQIPQFLHNVCLALLRLGEARLEVGAEPLAELRERDAVRVQVELLLQLVQLLGRL